MATVTHDLTVRGEAVERVYGNFEDRRYIVNRRYQRKLIWSLEEKRNFIDSIIEGYPVPIILLAEDARRGNDYEIIDGMQRLDAIVSFIRNMYTVRDKYFDLNTIAVSKALLDNGSLTQHTPIMDREICVRIASYLLPLSIYEFADERSVDTVFRRINSGGRQLSRQELRAAGSVGNFATSVRRISAKVRGDDSYSDMLRLNEMQKISITNNELNYGIDVETIFWVAQGILSRDNVRQSRDEELVADLVAYMVSENPISSRTEFLDDFFEMGTDSASQARFLEVDSAIKKRSTQLVITDFQRTLDQITLTLEQANDTFVHLLFNKPISPAPRYFQVVFLAFYELIVKKNLSVNDRAGLAASLKGIGDRLVVQEGGRWGADNREKSIESAIGMIQKYFAASGSVDPAIVHWITQLQNLLSQSYTEQTSYDFKQGFLLLDGNFTFDDNSFEKIMKTCVAIANIAKGHKGYVLVGIADNDATVARIEALYGITCRSYDRFKISGIEHEASKLGKNLDQFFAFITAKINASSISEPLKSYITSRIKPVRYYDKTVYVFEISGQESPSLYDNKYYERIGANVSEVAPANFSSLFERYNSRN